MTIKVGDKLPAGTLSEYIEVEGNGCTIGPNTFKVEDLTRGKKVVIFGLPGAFTPTCSAKHVPSYLANYDKLKAKGVDDILCMSVNDAFVMGAWARDQKAGGRFNAEHSFLPQSAYWPVASTGSTSTIKPRTRPTLTRTPAGTEAVTIGRHPTMASLVRAAASRVPRRR